SKHLAQKIPGTLLPTPRQVAIEEIRDQQPRPRLYLSTREQGDQYLHNMRLRFAYGDDELAYSKNETIYSFNKDDTIVRIWRDEAAEDAAIEQIESCGFEALQYIDENDLFFHSLNTNNPSEEINCWHRFLTETLPQLEQQGWKIEFDNSFNMIFHQAEQWNIEIEEDGNDWFDLRFEIEMNDQSLDLLPLIAQVLTQYEPNQLPDTLTLALGDNQYLNIASDQLTPVLNTLYELFDKNGLQTNGSLRMSRFDAARLHELEEQGSSYLQWNGGDALRKLGRQLKDFQGITAVEPPKGLKITLRDYQRQGLNWLQFLREYGFAGILADDMGLGKTVQTLAYLLLEKEQGRMDKPCLIIAPTSLMSNWRREAEQFTPALKVLVLQGPERQKKFDQINKHDLILSTYPLLARDEEALLSHHYHTLILDEAQVVKNPKAKAAQVVRRVKTDQRLCLTGTPMENHLGELWALFDFLMPGFLGEARQFNNLFRTPIEKQGDELRSQQLTQRIAPFMLRRTKSEVVLELPEKTEIIRTVSLEKGQAALYESIRMSMEHKVRQAIANKGLSGSHITILDALLKLRQVCCDPRLLSLAQARTVKESAKLDLLMQMLPEMVEEGRRILLFSAFTKMLGHIEAALKKHDISYSKLTGQTRNRDAAIESFKSGEADVFLISLKAGGVGLNLTEADTVIHYDPWWNPAAENQATDRAHRIGQNKAVFVYKLVTENSVEEKIIAMQAKKQALADAVYDKGKQGEENNLSTEDLNLLFAPM
ncbi:MAG TPA: helicase SNF2, partial [Candidatus Tenderia electrophaga]|nr:helicase SNF2 [Candidatus Tenderia electrophaga]